MTGRHAILAFLAYSNTHPAVSKVLDFYFTVLHDNLSVNWITIAILISSNCYTSKENYKEKHRCLACGAFLLEFCISRTKKRNLIKSVFLNNIWLPVWLDMLVMQCPNEQNKEDSSLFLSLHLTYFHQPLLWMVVIEKGGIEWWNNFDDCTALSEIFRGSQFSCYENIFMIRISLIKVLDVILMGRQSGQKLQYLYGNPMTDNFLKTWILHNLRIATLKYWVEDCIHQVWLEDAQYFPYIHLQIFFPRAASPQPN